VHPVTDAGASGRAAILKLYRDLWEFLGGERRSFAGALQLLALAQIVLLAVPYLSGRALDTIQLRGLDGIRAAGCWLSAGFLTACVGWLLHGPGRVLERRSALTVRRNMAARLLQSLFNRPLQWHESQHSAATAHRVQQSSRALSAFAQSQFIYLNGAVRLIGPLVALWWLQPAVGGAAALGIVLITVSVCGFDRAMLRLANLENDAERRYSAGLVDALGNTRTVYSLRQVKGISARLERRLADIFAPLKQFIVLNEAKWCVVDLASRGLSCALAALFVWLAYRARTPGAGHTLLLGSLYMVWEYAQQAGSVMSSIASNFQIFARQQADYASADVIQADAGHESAPGSVRTGLAQPSAPWRRLEIRDLTFRHAGARFEGPTLDRVCLHLERTRRYAVIGSSGSGKSTLLHVLAGLYCAERMALRIDGAVQESAAAAAQALRAAATLIPQDAEVYEGTLAENLGLCESVYGPPQARAYGSALDAACAHFVQAAPAGLDSQIAEQAVNWSGGQRSRIALARGVLAADGSALVLMDEPTANLDPVTELQVYANLFATFGGACLVSSVHRLSLLGLFDEVLVMREGRLVAQGSPSDLATGSAEFQRLVAAQGWSGTPGARPEASHAA
jgi:ABC-type multidrug transport system fused ATPase/permease subunit